MTTLMDINADLGESPEALANGGDFELMRHITSANVACGGHAGNESTMTQTVRAAKELNVSVGAHPSYPDRENFGRLESPILAAALESSVRQQILSLAAVAERLAVRLVHVKPHGALYHAANKSGEIALAIGRAVQAIDPHLIMVGQAESSALEVWRELGLGCAAEAFADRSYEPDGTLRKRTLPGALLDTPESAAQQALDIVLRQRVRTSDGTETPVMADTICIHSDTPGAAAIAREVNRRLQAAGVQLRALSLHGTVRPRSSPM
jgi:5-oxoprolinase (ATP-hydrolysing) subunit A